jgi:hypothetical protein
MQLTIMVKSISPSSRGRYNPKKKKVWIKNNEERDSDIVEIEVEIYDFSDYSIHFYDKNGKIILDKKEKNHLNILV